METQVLSRKPYPTDVSDDEWAFVAPYLTLMAADAPQRVHEVREVLRWAAGRKAQPTGAIFDSATRQSSPESGHRAGYDGDTRRQGSKIHVAVDPLGHLLALHVTPADVQDREQVGTLAAAVQAATGQTVELACVDQGYTDDTPVTIAAEHGLRLEVIKLPETKRGFVLLPRRWVVERSFAWAARCHRLAKDYERVPKTVAGLHFVAFACLMLHRLVTVVAQSP
jgi:transposase